MRAVPAEQPRERWPVDLVQRLLLWADWRCLPGSTSVRKHSSKKMIEGAANTETELRQAGVTAQDLQSAMTVTPGQMQSVPNPNYQPYNGSQAYIMQMGPPTVGYDRTKVAALMQKYPALQSHSLDDLLHDLKGNFSLHSGSYAPRWLPVHTEPTTRTIRTIALDMATPPMNPAMFDASGELAVQQAQAAKTTAASASADGEIHAAAARADGGQCLRGCRSWTQHLGNFLKGVQAQNIYRDADENTRRTAAAMGAANMGMFTGNAPPNAASNVPVNASPDSPPQVAPGGPSSSTAVLAGA